MSVEWDSFGVGGGFGFGFSSYCGVWNRIVMCFVCDFLMVCWGWGVGVGLIVDEEG